MLASFNKHITGISKFQTEYAKQDATLFFRRLFFVRFGLGLF